MKKEQSQNYKKLKLIASVTGASLILIISILGSSYGIYSSATNSGDLDNTFNQRALIESDISLSEGTTIREAGDSIDDTLEFIGFNNTNVYISGEGKQSRVIIDTPISSYVSDQDSDNVIDASKTPETNISFLEEVAGIYSTTLFNPNLDFRSTDGQQIFTKTDKGYEYDGSVLETDDDTTESYAFKTSGKYNDYDFYKSASVSYSNGQPVINVSLNDNNTQTTFLNAFQEFNKDLEAGGKTFDIWLGYDQLEDFLQIVTGDTSANLYDYKDSKYVKPFYIGSSSSTIMNSKYADRITIKTDNRLSDKEAKFYAKKINNTELFTASNETGTVNVSLYTSQKSKIALYVMALLFILVIFVIAAIMLWYLGLLGLLASSVFLAVNAIVVAIFASASLTVTMMALISLIVLAFVSGWLIFVLTNRYRFDNEDKYLTPTKRYFEKLRIFNKELFASVVSISILVFVAGMLLPAIIASPLYIFVIGIVLTYAMCLLLQLAIYGVDSLINFTGEYFDCKWSPIIGRIDPLWNKEIKYNDSISKRRTTILTLSSIIVLLISFIMGGGMYLTTGSAINTNMYSTQSYYYNVRVIDAKEVSMINSDEEQLDPVDSFYDATKTLEDDVREAFKDAGYRPTSINLVRNDAVAFGPISGIDEISPENKLQDDASFGFNITTSKKIEGNSIDKVNEKLAEIETQGISVTSDDIDLTIDLSDGAKGFEINENKLSLNNSNPSKFISISSESEIEKTIFMMIIVILVFGFITIFVAKWGAALSVMISSSVEAILFMAPLFVLFLPYAQILLLPLTMLFTLSASVKIYITKKVKNSEKKTEDVWIKNTERSQFLILLVSAIISILSLLLIPVYGLALGIIFGLFTLWFGFISLITQRYVFTYFAKILTGFNDRVRNNKISDDIRRSKSSDEPQEEYIEGVNM